MKKLVATLALAALAAPAATPAATVAAVPVRVVMSEPGCHTFVVSGSRKTTIVRAAPVTIVNHDSAALVYRGPGFRARQAVGAKLTLRGKGTYKIRMVGQKMMDYTLTAVVR